MPAPNAYSRPRDWKVEAHKSKDNRQKFLKEPRTTTTDKILALKGQRLGPGTYFTKGWKDPYKPIVLPQTGKGVDQLQMFGEFQYRG